MQRLVTLFALLFVLPFGAAQGQNASSNPPVQPLYFGRGEPLYLGGGKALESSPARQLTLNAHVQQFAYQPGGLAVACAGGRLDGDSLTLTVQMIGLHQDTPRRLWSRQVGLSALAGSLGLDENGTRDLRDRIDSALPLFRRGYFLNLVSLPGWWADGRYLLIKLQDVVPTDGGAGYRFQDFYTSVDVAADPPHVYPVPLAALLPDDDFLADSRVSWSPKHTRLLLTAFGRRSSVTAWYDFAANRLSAVLGITDSEFRGWLDEDHWLLEIREEGAPNVTQFVQDIATGRRTPAPRPLAAAPDWGRDQFVSPKNPELSLDVEQKTVEDEQKSGTQPAQAIWIRRANAPKRYSVIPVGLTPGFEYPQAQWSPTGGQVAFVGHGDLFVTDLLIRDASARQKLAAGDTLSCAEENEIARSNMKQIGLALFQYAFDRDERFPPPGGLEARLSAYLKDPSLYSVGGARFNYQPPPNRKIGEIENPAQTPLATMDLPCARDILYADGHVGTVPKQP